MNFVEFEELMEDDGEDFLLPGFMLFPSLI